MTDNPLTEQQVAELGLADWRFDTDDDGDAIQGDFHRGTFSAAGAFAAQVSSIADGLDHHPAIDIRYPDLVQVRSSSHDAGGVTDRDVQLATAVSAAAAAASGAATGEATGATSGEATGDGS
ncbi:MAG: 4a-hydroxytetrahydrobiopterin dehydratase [Actinomycetota bacterium]|nr:4a-hydroxytetrahydrobiopterin dehydratase [Actinomycetota bacterium]